MIQVHYLAGKKIFISLFQLGFQACIAKLQQFCHRLRHLSSGSVCTAFVSVSFGLGNTRLSFLAGLELGGEGGEWAVRGVCMCGVVCVSIMRPLKLHT